MGPLERKWGMGAVPPPASKEKQKIPHKTEAQKVADQSLGQNPSIEDPIIGQRKRHTWRTGSPTSQKPIEQPLSGRTRSVEGREAHQAEVLKGVLGPDSAAIERAFNRMTEGNFQEITFPQLQEKHQVRVLFGKNEQNEKMFIIFDDQLGSGAFSKVFNTVNLFDPYGKDVIKKPKLLSQYNPDHVDSVKNMAEDYKTLSANLKNFPLGDRILEKIDRKLKKEDPDLAAAWNRKTPIERHNLLAMCQWDVENENEQELLIKLEGTPGIIAPHHQVQTGSDKSTHFIRSNRCLATAENCPFLKEYPLAQRIGVVKELSQGVEALKAHGIHHGDIKLANVLLDEEHGTLTGKLADFGGSRDVATQGTARTFTPHYLPRLHSYQEEDWHQFDQYANALVCLQILDPDRDIEQELIDLFDQHPNDLEAVTIGIVTMASEIINKMQDKISLDELIAITNICLEPINWAWSQL